MQQGPSGPELIREAEKQAAEKYQTSTGFEIIIPHGVSTEQAVKICLERLEQRRQTPHAMVGGGLPAQYHAKKAQAMQEFVDTMRHEGKVPRDLRLDPSETVSGPGGVPGGGPVLVVPTPDNPMAQFAVPGMPGGGLGRQITRGPLGFPQGGGQGGFGGFPQGGGWGGPLGGWGGPMGGWGYGGPIGGFGGPGFGYGGGFPGGGGGFGFGGGFQGQQGGFGGQQGGAQQGGFGGFGGGFQGQQGGFGGQQGGFGGQQGGKQGGFGGQQGQGQGQGLGTPLGSLGVGSSQQQQ